MYENLKKHACPNCNFSTSRKFNLDRHIKRKHQEQHHHPVQVQQLWNHHQGDRAHALFQQHDQKYAVQGVEMPIFHQQPVKEKQIVEQHPLDVVNHHPQPVFHQPVHHHHPQPVLPQPVQAQQGWTQQQGGRVHALYPQHNRHHDEVKYQPQYELVKVLDLDFLMLEDNIEYVLQNVKHFLGCFPSDSLPPFPTTFPKSMIINTQASTQTGEHWVALVLTETQCHYFDSFAQPIQPNIRLYLQPYYDSICRSRTQIQDVTSNYCGAYSVSFVLHVRDDVSHNNFINHYKSKYLLQNDEILKQDFSNIDFLVEM